VPGLDLIDEDDPVARANLTNSHLRRQSTFIRELKQSRQAEASAQAVNTSTEVSARPPAHLCVSVCVCVSLCLSVSLSLSACVRVCVRPSRSPAPPAFSRASLCLRPAPRAPRQRGPALRPRVVPRRRPAAAYVVAWSCTPSYRGARRPRGRTRTSAAGRS